MTNQSASAPGITEQECADGSAVTHIHQQVIAVGEENGWAAAEELKEVALDALNASGDIVLDFSGIDYLEASGLQVVLAIGAECARAGKSLDLQNLSPDLRGLLEQCGAADHLSSYYVVNQ